MSTGDWLFAAHSGYEAAQPRGPWFPAGAKEDTKTYEKCRLVSRKHLGVRIMGPTYTENLKQCDNITATATASFQYALNGN